MVSDPAAVETDPDSEGALSMRGDEQGTVFGGFIVAFDFLDPDKSRVIVGSDNSE